MRKRALWLSAVGVVAMLVAGGIFASNMGFKLNYSMGTGTNSLGLPYNAQTNITNAETLINDIEAANPGTVSSVSRFDTASNGLITYTGSAGTNFPLTPGEAYHVAAEANVTGYIPSHY